MELLINPCSSSYTFTDLAQIVCRIPETYPDQHYSSSEDEYYDGYISEPSTLHMKARNRFRMKRTGGSLSLSENEFDSDDLEMPVPFNLSEKTRERLNSASRSNKAKEEESVEPGVEAVAKSKEGSPSRSTGSEETSDAVDGKEKGESASKESTGGDKDEEQEDYVELVK